MDGICAGELIAPGRSALLVDDPADHPVDRYAIFQFELSEELESLDDRRHALVYPAVGRSPQGGEEVPCLIGDEMLTERGRQCLGKLYIP